MDTKRQEMHSKKKPYSFLLLCTTLRFSKEKGSNGEQ